MPKQSKLKKKHAELTTEQRTRIEALKDAGWTYRRIAADIQCSISTIKYTLDHFKHTGEYKNKLGRGRKRKLTESDVKHL